MTEKDKQFMAQAIAMAKKAWNPAKADHSERL